MNCLVEAGKVENLEFKWGKKRGVGGKKKEVQFYGSFTYDNVEYTLHDCVYMHKDEEHEPYIGKLIKIWENPDKTKKIKVQWFFRPSEILNWLGDEEALENEIFLASGVGVGLANVNPLEAIAGKCNVVCISEDSRNPQPSGEERQMADYIFYRTFDVGHCTILDKMDDKVGGLEVKFIFNRKESENTSGLGSERTNENKNSVAYSEFPQLSERNSPEEFSVKTNEMVKEDVEVKDLLVKRESLPRGKSTSGAGVDSSKVDTTNVEQGSVSDVKATKSKVDSDKVEVKVNKVSVNQVEVEEKVKFAEDSRALDNRPSKKARVDSSVKLSEDKNMNDAKALVTTAISSKEKTKSGLVKNSLGPEKGVKSAKDSSAFEDGPSMKVRVDCSVNLSEDKNRNGVQELSVNSGGNDAKYLATTISSEEKPIFKLARDSLGSDKGSFKKQKPDEKIRKLSNGKLLTASTGEAADEDTKIGERFEVTRKPEDDRSKWFRELPWEERMQNAHEQGTLVLLQNLDPEYTSGEVEDIIWHGFKENCTAKMVQHTAISSPHSGQAFVIFKTMEAAERVIRKLDAGCLMLSSGRPLVGSVGPHPCLLGKHSTFAGHLSIDKIKIQMQREMKEAVSTSHCSQPNTIEYEMAMEWCLLQSRSDSWWKRLYKQQGEELRKLKVNLKSK